MSGRPASATAMGAELSAALDSAPGFFDTTRELVVARAPRRLEGAAAFGTPRARFSDGHWTMARAGTTG
jgi:hypothetical protein